MSRRTAYLGDDGRPGPASYLCGIMTHFGIPFLHVPSSEAPPEGVFADDIGLYILSDYPSERFSKDAMDKLCARIRAGAGLLMLGGWESYHGLGGDYDQTPLADLLPVDISPGDDRHNWSQLCLVRASQPSHPVLAGLPFDRPPGIGGYNAFRPKPGTDLLMEGERYRIQVADGAPPMMTLDWRFPLLVTRQEAAGAAGAGRRACLATDVAPHWVGGFVDWGDKRLRVDMAGGDFIEVGAGYARFFANLVDWTRGALG